MSARLKRQCDDSSHETPHASRQRIEEFTQRTTTSGRYAASRSIAFQDLYKKAIQEACNKLAYKPPPHGMVDARFNSELIRESIHLSKPETALRRLPSSESSSSEHHTCTIVGFYIGSSRKTKSSLKIPKETVTFSYTFRILWESDYETQDSCAESSQNIAFRDPILLDHHEHTKDGTKDGIEISPSPHSPRTKRIIRKVQIDENGTQDIFDDEDRANAFLFRHRQKHVSRVEEVSPLLQPVGFWFRVSFKPGPLIGEKLDPIHPLSRFWVHRDWLEVHHHTRALLHQFLAIGEPKAYLERANITLKELPRLPIDRIDDHTKSENGEMMFRVVLGDEKSSTSTNQTSFWVNFSTIELHDALLATGQPPFNGNRAKVIIDPDTLGINMCHNYIYKLERSSRQTQDRERVDGSDSREVLSQH